MDKALKELIEISRKVGKDARLVQGGGGNTSVKTADGKFMYIKASGTALKDMSTKAGFRRMSLEQVRSIIEDRALAGLETYARETEVVNRLLAACRDDVKTGARPSVEAHLHAGLERYVVHLHPDAVGAFVCAKNGKVQLAKLFAQEKYPPLWVPYCDPGYMLAKKITGLVKTYRAEYGRMPSVLFLENHGVLFTAGTAAKCLGLVRKVIRRCGAELKRPRAVQARSVSMSKVHTAKLALRKAFFEGTGRYSPVGSVRDAAIAAFAADKDVKQMLGAGAIMPDELVYANGPAMWVDKVEAERIASEVKRAVSIGNKPPSCFLVEGLGLFVLARPEMIPTLGEVQTSSFFVRYNAFHMGGIKPLNRRQKEFINKWESEAFRKSLASGAGEGPLQDRITIVSGAGSGLGRSIAVGLARAGAMVGLADVDAAAAKETAAMIKKELPKSATLVLGCDVTDESSVEACFGRLLDGWGGLDILVNAAGVAPAYPLVELPADKWRLCVEVNLTGYFLMAKHAARIMIKQGIGGNIINISSKSGLEASSNNTPYNATKAGEIHMARGWAMELGEHGIRVNCICPGNVFEGSKIWNPQYIKACAKKYGIKPEQVIPYYINKTILKREIKGQDVADAVVFLCSERARAITGQIIVPDAGQVMVR